MERDLDLIKSILLKMEDTLPGTVYNSEDFVIDGHEADEVHFHMWLLKESRLIEGFDVSTMGNVGPQIIPTRITMTGYDFLQATKNESIWNKAKESLTAAGGGASLDIVKTLLTKLTIEGLGLS